MKEQAKDIVGYIGGSLLIVTLIPQIYKTYKTKSTKDVSLHWELLFFLGTLLILIYTYSEGIIPLAITESIELTFISCLLYMKFKYNTNNPEITHHRYVNSEQEGGELDAIDEQNAIDDQDTTK